MIPSVTYRIKLITTVLFILFTFNLVGSKNKWDSDKSDWTILMKAVYKGHHKKIKKIIVKDVNVNYCTKSGLTALSIAIRKQDTISVKLLLNSNKISIDSSGNLIMLACNYKSVQVVKILHSHNFPIKDYDNGFSPLMAACNFGSKEIIQYLIENNSNVNSKREIDGLTPLMFAVGSGDLEKVKLLLSKGADKNAKDKNGNNMAYYLNNISSRLNAKEEDIKKIRVLLEN
jgi:ankyrin repeat protein